MGAFKKLNQQDAYISTYNARKSWTASGSEYRNLGILQLVGETSTGAYIPQAINKVYGGGVSFSDDPDITKFDKILLYRSIKQLYYSNFEDAVINTSSSFDNFLQSSFNVSGSRELRDSIALFSLPKEIYGTHIEPNSVRLALDTPPPDRDYVTSNYVTLNGIDSNDDQYNQYTSPASDIIDGGYIIDDGEGNLILPESTPAGKKVGNIIYTHGNIIITDDVIAENFNDYFNAAIEWKSNLPIYTHNYHCRVKANELNYSLNKTAIDTNTGQIEDNITGSAFQPYVTTIGLYNDANELIAVAKTPTPIPKSTNTDMSFHIQLDMNFAVNRIDSVVAPTVPIDYNAELRVKVALWISDEAQAIINYGDINTWDTSKVTDMSDLFRDELTFNSNISNWDVSSVATMDSMFRNAEAFNQPIGNWDVSSVTDMDYMFTQADVFNQPLANWDVSNVTRMSRMFNDTTFNQPIDSWDVSSVTNMGSMFVSSDFNQPIGSWDVSSVTWMAAMFFSARDFNQPLNNWDVSNGPRMTSMFNGAWAFDQPLDNWDVSNVTTMNSMFENANSFNQNINSWDVSNVTNMGDMFRGADLFNQPLSNWNVSNVTIMEDMFDGAVVMNQDLSSWAVSNVTDCTDFSANTPSWTLSKPIFTNCTP